MENIIGISTGSIFRFAQDNDNAIDMLHETGTKAIELLTASIDELDHGISEKNGAYLRSLDYVSIHAPFNRKGKEPLIYDDDDTTRDVLRKIKALAGMINARHVVIHPNLVRSWRPIQESGLSICVENMPKKREIPLPFFRELLREHPDLSLVLNLKGDIDPIKVMKEDLLAVKRATAPGNDAGYTNL